MLFGKYINKYYKKYFWLFFFGIISLILVDVAALHIPPFFKEVTSIYETATLSGMGWTDELINNVVRMAWFLMAVAATMLVGRILFRFTLFSASHKIEAELRHEMYLKAEKLSVSYYHENPVGTVMSWFTNDISVVQEFLGWGTVMLVDAIFMSSLTLVCLFRCSWQLSIIVIIPILLIVVWGLLVEDRMDKQWGYRQKAYDELYDFSQENFTGIRVIKAFVKENKQIHSFAKVARKNRDINVKFARINIIFDVMITLIVNCISALIIGFGGWFLYATITGTPINFFGTEVFLNAPTLVEFIGYFDTLIWPMIALGQVVAMFSRSKGSLRRISNFLSADIAVKNPENAITLTDIKGQISFKNFSFTYPGNNKPALDNISLIIKPGEKIGVVGKIGCGKTTLMNILLRIYNVNNDSVFVDDVDLMQCDLKSVRDSIAYVPQDNFLYSDTIHNNIAFSNASATDEEVSEAAAFACVDGDIKNFANGYETISGERGVTLSGGQKQRISIARAYLKKAPILIMDDSVSAVDVKTEETILKNINELRKGMTTILIASRISTVSHMDKIIVLKEGKLEAFDTPENLLKTSPTYQAMHMLQELEVEEGGTR